MFQQEIQPILGDSVPKRHETGRNFFRREDTRSIQTFQVNNFFLLFKGVVCEPESGNHNPV